MRNIGDTGDTAPPDLVLTREAERDTPNTLNTQGYTE